MTGLYVFLILVAGVGFEPTTFGLCARRAARLLHPAAEARILTNPPPTFKRMRKISPHPSIIKLRRPRRTRARRRDSSERRRCSIAASSVERDRCTRGRVCPPRCGPRLYRQAGYRRESRCRAPLPSPSWWRCAWRGSRRVAWRRRRRCIRRESISCARSARRGVPTPTVRGRPRRCRYRCRISPCARRLHQPLHLAHRLLQAGEERARDDGVADVQFAYRRDRSDRRHVVIVQAVTGVDVKTGRRAVLHRGGDALQLRALRARVLRLGIVTGVYLDRGGATVRRRIHQPRDRVDEQSYAATRRGEPLAGLAHTRLLRRHVKATFGGQLFTPLRHETHLLGTYAFGDHEHFVGHSLLEIHARLLDVLHHQHIALLYMTTVFAQMQRDGGGTGLLGRDRGLHRVGITRAARLAQGGDVVDVDAQQNGVSCAGCGVLDGHGVLFQAGAANKRRLASGLLPSCAASAVRINRLASRRLSASSRHSRAMSSIVAPRIVNVDWASPVSL